MIALLTLRAGVRAASVLALLATEEVVLVTLQAAVCERLASASLLVVEPPGDARSAGASFLRQRARRFSD